MTTPSKSDKIGDMFSFFRKKKRTLILRPQGELANLQEIYHILNAKYFENALDLYITWFGNKDFKPKRRIHLGSYHPDKKLIKVHRLLDQSHVPKEFVSFIVYHEMLHHVLPPIIRRNQRRKIHHPEFRNREKEFEEYITAKDFEKKLQKFLFS